MFKFAHIQKKKTLKALLKAAGFNYGIYICKTSKTQLTHPL